jgi:hypothetical protein
MRLSALLLCLVANVCAHAQTINPHLNSRLRQTTIDGYYWMPTAIADDYFDGTSSPSRVRRHFEIAKNVGATYLRCAFTWNAIEKKQGKYDWRFWDMLVTESERAGIKLIPYVAYTPEWAAGTEDQFWKRPPTNPHFYADFMYQISRRYRGRIFSWEIWNEPDIEEYWMGDADQFAELVQLAAASIRRGDPDATIVLAGMSKGPSPFFKQLIARHEIERVIDVVAMHGYPESWLEERAETVHQTWTSEMSTVVQQTGANRDLWINEIGYADYRFSSTTANKYGVSAVFPHEHTAEYAAASLFKSQVMALASDEVSLTGWYRIDDFDPRTTTFSDDHVNFHLGLLDVQQRLKPTYFALKFFNSLFRQPSRPLTAHVFSLAAPSDAVLNLFQRRDGTMVLVGWLRALTRDRTDATGREPDARRETLSVELPCSGIAKMNTLDAQGHVVANTTEYDRGWLSNVSLTPDTVFIADITCTTPRNQRITPPFAATAALVTPSRTH